MRISEKNLKIIVHCVMAVFLLVFFAYLAIQKSSFGENQVYQISPVSSNKFIQGPYPIGRINPIDNHWQIVVEPIYFKIYSPKKFSQAQITIIYKKNIELSAKLGVKLSDHDYAFYFHDFNDNNNDWQTQEFIFDLANADFTKNKLQFIISGPDIVANDFLIKEIGFTLIK